MLAPSTQLARFVHAAKTTTYAAQGDDASVEVALPDSKQLEYRDGEYFYRDIYVGMFRFVGQEIVYYADRAIWSMSYAGGLVHGVGHHTAKPVYAFLRSALLAAPPDAPLRGPSLLEGGGMRYVCQWHGSLEQFHGVERVTQGSASLYELRFAGGILA